MEMYAKFQGKGYIVVSPDEYFTTITYGGPNCYNEQKTMILCGGYLYPIKHSYPSAINPEHGCYCFANGHNGMVRWITNDENYRNFELVDLRDPSCVKELITSLEKVSQIRKDTLAPDGDDNIFKTELHPQDTAIMKALKTFISEKHVDMNLYADRFGANYSNDIRLLNKPDITIKKFNGFIENLDATCELVINNRDSNVANPLTREIRVKLV